MPNIVFASNNIAHFPNANAGSVVGTFDNARVPYSIQAENDEELGSPVFTPVTGDTTWFNFRIYCHATVYNGANTMLRAYDTDDNVLFNIRKRPSVTSGQAQIQLFDGSTSQEVDLDTLLTFKKINFVSVKYTQTNLGIELEVYINGQLAGTAEFFSNPNNYGNPVRFVIGCPFTNGGLNGDDESKQPYSEIIVADGDTRNGRLDMLRPAAAGTFEEWEGSIGVLADDDTTTGMTTLTGGDKQTVTLSAYTGASNISNLVTISQTTRGQNSPTQLQHLVRLSGVDYPSAAKLIPFELAYQITDYNTNPATSLPWTASDLSAIETGFESVT